MGAQLWDQLVCFLCGIFLFKKKKKGRCRKTTASYDLILLKIPGYVSVSLLVPDFFLLTFILIQLLLKGNKYQLYKEVALIFFFQNILNYRAQLSYLIDLWLNFFPWWATFYDKVIHILSALDSEDMFTKFSHWFIKAIYWVYTMGQVLC